jgi:hypothetical protein
MTSSDMPQAKFLSKADELGVVAVGFSGGQVRYIPPLLGWVCFACRLGIR